MIAFARRDAQGYAYLLQVSANGGEPRPIPGNPGTAGDPGFAWSPDGSRVAFAGPDGIVVANADGSDARLVAGHDGALWTTNPRWSPDGRFVLYDLFSTQGDAIWPWVVGKDGADQHAVSGDGGYSADWQPILEPLPVNPRATGRSRRDPSSARVRGGRFASPGVR